jgi:ankyrin repeat protein
MADNANNTNDNALLDAIVARDPLEEIRLIVEWMPHLIKLKVVCNHQLWLPLHLAVVRGMPPEVAQFLYECWPQALREVDYDGGTLMHSLGTTLREFPVRIETVEFLVEEWPNALELPTINQRELPIHRVVANRNLSVEVARLFLDRNPASIRARDAYGNVPLYSALRSGNPSPELVQLLVQTWPGSVQDRAGASENSGVLPLFFALRYKASVGVVRILVEEWQESVGKRDSLGRTALHAAIVSRVSLGVVRCLVDHRPESLDERTDSEERSLPLHVAASYGAPMQVVEFVVDQRPDALAQADGRGRLPLHVAARHGAPPNVLRFLVERRPQSARERDSDGDLPLHSLFERRTAPVSVQIFLHAWPESALEKGRNGQVPLHLAVAAHLRRHPFQLDVIRLLADQGGPEAVLARDDAGQVPLHVAAKGGDQALDVASLLIERGPASVRALDRHCRLPLHVALLEHSGSSPALVRLLVAAFPESVRVRDRYGIPPLHVVLSHEGDNCSIEIVQHLLEAWPESALVRASSSGLVPMLMAATSNASLDVLCFLVRRSLELFSRR